MDQDRSGTLEDEGVRALALMQEALVLLDRCDGVTVVGAHLDLAICRLRDMIGEHRKMSSVVEERIGSIDQTGTAN
jgi:hypothetical protein